MGTKADPSAFDCYANAEPDEPMFVLLARDPLAADIVRTWVARHSGAALTGRPYSEKEQEALRCADAMDAWRDARQADA